MNDEVVSDSSSDKLLPTIWHPWMGENFRAVRFPVTTPTRYLSYSVALNLRLPGEDTGDWHGDVPFITSAENPDIVRPAGPGGLSDSTPSLGCKGVRDMAHVLEGEYMSAWLWAGLVGQPLPSDCGLRAR